VKEIGNQLLRAEFSTPGFLERAMKLVFVDVGQGSCNLLVWDRGRSASVIDCGSRAKEILTALWQFEVRKIKHLFVSHNDKDHAGGVAPLLTEFRGAIDDIYFLQDVRLFQTSFWARIKDEMRLGYLRENQIHRLETHRNPRRVYTDVTGDIRMDILAPSTVSNIVSNERKRSNSTSGVLEWLACTDPQAMMEFLRGKAGERPCPVKTHCDRGDCAKHFKKLVPADQEPGCQDQEILSHCRSGGEHVRGCWVVDLLLGKT
jgi:hypothetical protein